MKEPRYVRLKSHNSLDLPKRNKHSEDAFTRTELLAVCATLLLIALAVAPAAVTNKSDSERLVCFNNLRLIGRGIQMWAGDHNQQFPWRALDPDGDPNTLESEGEWCTVDRAANAWQEYRFLKNELVTPKILACPSDTGVVVAQTWQQYTTAGGRGRCTSYSVHLDAVIENHRSWLSADRNLRAEPGFTHCSANVIDASQITLSFNPSNSPVAWTNAVHGAFGHLLSTDGSVEFTSTPRIKELFGRRPGDDDNGIMHFLRAR